MRSSAHALAAAVLFWLGAAEATDLPVIGILAQETPVWGEYSSTLPAPYVKAVEGSGAQVVPIFTNMSAQYYRYMVSRINGVVFPGGSSDFFGKGGIGDSARHVYKLALELSVNGDHFPILGVCQGHEYLALLSNGGRPLLTTCNATNLNLPLKFKAGFRNSSLYGRVSEKDVRILAALPVTANHHEYCVTEDTLAEAGLEGTAWRVLTTSEDAQGLEFVSSMESPAHPFVGVQFHPEKNAYEWRALQDNPHGPKAVATARVFYDWVVREARRSEHAFADQRELADLLIYNYSPVYRGVHKMYDTQAYFFKPHGRFNLTE